MNLNNFKFKLSRTQMFEFISQKKYLVLQSEHTTDGFTMICATGSKEAHITTGVSVDQGHRCVNLH